MKNQAYRDVVNQLLAVIDEYNTVENRLVIGPIVRAAEMVKLAENDIYV